MSSLIMMTSYLIRTASQPELDIRRSRQMTAPTDSPSDVDESKVSSLQRLQSLSVFGLLSLYLQTPPLDLLAFLWSSATSSGSTSGFPAKTLPQSKFLSHIFIKHMNLHQSRFSFKTNSDCDEPLEKVRLWKQLISYKHSPSSIAHHV